MNKLVEYLPHNPNGRTFVVGDLHGCRGQFDTLLTQIKFDFENDWMLGSGDYGDRGPHSSACLDLLDESWFKGVRGNHDELLIMAVNDRAFDWNHWIRHGGGWASEISRDKLKMYADKVAALPVALVIGEGPSRFNVFHAEFHGSDADLDALNKKEKPPLSIQWGEELFMGRVSPDKHKGLSTSYVGHRISERVHRIGSHVYLDTGGFLAEREVSSRYGLSIIEPETGQIWQYQR